MRELPDWQDMPEPVSLVRLSWEDIEVIDTDNALSREDVIEIMRGVDSISWDSENDTFWGFVEARIQRHLDR